ncbi:unnamed protein product [Periconia digitata]|uniref:Uncharacterized protein n=1 Tax=Periconia digitata TaxID=1303443 RepID=A0A9W4XPQ9_9PLEO|nr:unnamed protein product [Periconia digitata]
MWDFALSCFYLSVASATPQPRSPHLPRVRGKLSSPSSFSSLPCFSTPKISKSTRAAKSIP